MYGLRRHPEAFSFSSATPAAIRLKAPVAPQQSKLYSLPQQSIEVLPQQSNSDLLAHYAGTFKEEVAHLRGALAHLDARTGALEAAQRLSEERAKETEKWLRRELRHMEHDQASATKALEKGTQQALEAVRKEMEVQVRAAVPQGRADEAEQVAARLLQAEGGGKDPRLQEVLGRLQHSLSMIR